MSRIALAAIAAATLMLSGVTHAQQQPAAAPPPPPLIDWDKIQIKTTDLGNKTYMLEGQGGNITVAVGSDGIIRSTASSRRCPTRSRRRSRRSRRCRSNT